MERALFQVLLPKCWLIYSFLKRVKGATEMKRVGGWMRILCTSGRGCQMQHVLLVLVLVILRSLPPFTSLFTVDFFSLLWMK